MPFTLVPIPFMMRLTRPVGTPPRSCSCHPPPTSPCPSPVTCTCQPPIDSHLLLFTGSLNPILPCFYIYTTSYSSRRHQFLFTSCLAASGPTFHHPLVTTTILPNTQPDSQLASPYYPVLFAKHRGTYPGTRRSWLFVAKSFVARCPSFPCSYTRLSSTTSSILNAPPQAILDTAKNSQVFGTWSAPWNNLYVSPFFTTSTPLARYCVTSSR